MENGVEIDVEVTPTPSPTPSPPRPRDGTDVVVATKGTSSRRRDSLRSEVRRKGSLRRDQRTGEKRQSLSSSLLGYEAKYPPLQFIENLATQPDYVFKILVVGNSYVGKSSFLMRLCTNAFSARYASTIGVDFYSKALKVDGRIISLQLWDTAGQERFQSVTKAYYRGAQGVILMYDICQEESFIAVKSWINSIQENVDQMPTGLMLIGNKQDLDDQNEREVATETGETFAKIYSAQFMETSAKTGFNVGNCLMDLVRTIKVHYEQGGPNRREKGIQISNKPKGSSCCGR